MESDHFSFGVDSLPSGKQHLGVGKGGSLLGSKIDRNGNILRKSAFGQIDEYRKKFSKVGSFFDSLFDDLMVEGYDLAAAYRTAKEWWNKEEIRFVAIDGTVYSRQLFDMIIFFAGSYSCEGTISFSENSVDVRYNDRFLEGGKDVSSCVPVFVNKIPEIDQTVLEVTDDDVEAVRPVTDELVLNNTAIDKFLMTFSEFYLAYKLAKSGLYDLVLLDRSLSNMYSSLIYDTSKRKNWQDQSSLIGYEVDGEPIDVNDITIARQHIVNSQLGLPAARGDYLRYAILNLLGDQRLGTDEIYNALGLSQKGQQKRAASYLKRSVEEGLVEEADGKYRLAPRYRRSWDRIRAAVEEMGVKIFSGDDPFIITKGGKSEWITTLDLAFLTLFCINLLVEECWKKRILLVGMTKDTTAREFKNHVIPICVNNKIWPTRISQEELDAIPNTDRMLLQSLSLHNADKIHPPWALIEYDSAFVTAVPDFKGRVGYVSGAVQNKITPSMLFVRSFVQLDQAAFDHRLRSNVLAVDRLVYPEFDVGSTVDFVHYYSGDEPIRFVLYRNKRVSNPMQNLVLAILKSMSGASIPEVFGHNRALYIADKVAKWNNEQFRRMVDSTGALITNNRGTREFVFYMNTFRERRESFESARR